MRPKGRWRKRRRDLNKSYHTKSLSVFTRTIQISLSRPSLYMIFPDEGLRNECARLVSPEAAAHSWAVQMMLCPYWWTVGREG